MRLLFSTILLFVATIQGRAQIAQCDTMVIGYVGSDIKFTDATFSSSDSDMLVPLINNTTTNFAYPQAKLINVSPLPAGTTLYDAGWIVFASAWNVGDTATARIPYSVSAPIPDNYTVRFVLLVTNFLPLNVDSCQFTDTLTINLKPVSSAAVHELNPIRTPFTLYPNPATNVLKVFLANFPATIDLFSACGKKVITAQLQSPTDQIDISRLPDGVYFVRDRRGRSIARFVKQQ
jgi:hypothetical protein